MGMNVSVPGGMDGKDVHRSFWIIIGLMCFCLILSFTFLGRKHML